MQKTDIKVPIFKAICQPTKWKISTVIYSKTESKLLK